MSWSKDRDRTLAHRATRGRIAWNSGVQGTYNVGANEKKRERRARAAALKGRK